LEEIIKLAENPDARGTLVEIEDEEGQEDRHRSGAAGDRTAGRTEPSSDGKKGDSRAMLVAMRSIPRSIWLALWAMAVVVLGAGSVAAGDRVYPTPEAVEPLAPGAQVPAVRVANVHGDPVSLREVLDGRGALLIFYRGGW
jgi:hypothetical protein